MELKLHYAGLFFNGAHAHDDENGKRAVYDTGLDGRELTEQEVKENGDIIPKS